MAGDNQENLIETLICLLLGIEFDFVSDMSGWRE